MAAPKITSQPDSQSAPEGGTVKFSIAASGSNITYQWQKNGGNISESNSASYTTPAIALADNGATFRCIVTNAAGADTSKNALLTVNVQAPVITAQPTNQTVTEGSTATFSIQATLSPTYQWYKNDILIANATTASYTTPAATMADSGARFKCVVTHAGFSVTSNNVTLIVKMAAPKITSQPSEQATLEGSTTTFSITAVGSSLFYQWYKNSVIIPNATGASYTTPALTLADNGAKFHCIVSNGGGSVTSSDALLIVNTAAPVILSNPSNTSVIEGNTATFSVSASGSSLSYQWQKNGSAITNATSASYTTPATTLADSGATFQCVVTNPGGRVTSGSATLSVAPAAPKITVQPSDQAAPQGTAVTFSIQASGSNLTYQWQKNGAPITGATGQNYTTAPVTLADNGAKFLCVVSNSTGSVTSNQANLTVNAAAPVITQQPSKQTISAGQTAVFSITATGSNLAYKWQRNGVAIDGATAASYTTPPATRADSGAAFRCVVSNSGGSVTSSAAILAVLTPQYNLRIAALGNGGMVSPDGNVTVSYGDSLQIKAIALAYYRFDHWKTDSGTVLILDSLNPATRVISNWGNAAISANFVLSSCTLSVASGENGRVAPAAPIVTTIGAPTTIKAIADSGYHFDHWIGAQGSPFITDSTKDSTTVVLLGNAEVQAVFAEGTRYKVTIMAALSANVIQTVFDTLVNPGDTVTLRAPDIADFIFVKWQVSGGSSYLIDSAGPVAKVVVSGGNSTVTALYNGTPVIYHRQIKAPSHFALRFHPATGILFFDVPSVAGKEVPVRLRLFDVSGRLLLNIMEKSMGPGFYQVALSGNGSRRLLANRIDICVMESIGFRRSITVTIVR